MDNRATETVLASFGASRSSLSPEQRALLDERGFLVLPGALDAATVSALRARFDELVDAEQDRPRDDFERDPGASRLANLVDKDPLFDRCWNHPLQLAAVAHVLDWQELKLFSLNGRAALPGEGHQRLHADWATVVEPGLYQVCNSLWMLDDFTEENGATRVVPGSHRWALRPDEALSDPVAPHPAETLVLGPAGTCVVFNAHLWHGGTRNTTTAPRRALHSAFVRRHQPQQTVQREHLGTETVARLSSEQRYLLDV